MKTDKELILSSSNGDHPWQCVAMLPNWINMPNLRIPTSSLSYNWTVIKQNLNFSNRFDKMVLSHSLQECMFERLWYGLLVAGCEGVSGGRGHSYVYRRVLHSLSDMNIDFTYSMTFTTYFTLLFDTGYRLLHFDIYLPVSTYGLWNLTF